MQIHAGFLINLYLTVMMKNNASFKKQNCESTIRYVWIHFCMVCKGDKENSISFSGECKSWHVGGTHKRKNFVSLCMHSVSFILACLTIMLLCAALNFGRQPEVCMLNPNNLSTLYYNIFGVLCGSHRNIFKSKTISWRGSNSYRMSVRGAWIGTTSARGNVNSKRRQPRGVYIPRAEVIPIHAP